MLEVVIIMFAGMLIGYVFRKKTALNVVIGKSTLWTIFLLLFFMGLTIGKNDLIMQKLSTLGLTALIITLSAVMGSVIFAWLGWVLFLSNIKKQR